MSYVEFFVGESIVFSPFVILNFSISQGLILVGNILPNESGSNWDLPLSVLPNLLDRYFGPIDKLVGGWIMG